MKVCFVWVAKFKNLINYDVNLSSDYTYTYNHDTHFLWRENNDALPNDIFGESVSDITGILGINGAGKTNTLELICLTLKSKDKINGDYIVIYEKNNQLRYISSFEKNIDVFFSLQRKYDHKELNDLHVIFFSNVFDKNYLDLGKNVSDVSVNNKNNPRTMAMNRTSLDVDILSDVRFIKSEEFNKLELELPRKLDIKVERSPKNQMRQRFRDVDSIEDKCLKNLNDFFQESRKRHKLKNGLEVICLNIKISFLMFLVSVDSSIGLNTSTNCSESDFLIVLDNILNTSLNNDLNINDVIYELKKINSNYSLKFQQWNDSFTYDEIFDVLLSLEHLFQEMGMEIDDTIKGQRSIFSIDFDRTAPWWYERIAFIITSLRYSSIAWSGISSGQRAYLNLFSSIWGALSNNQNNYSDKEGVLICIDEGDLYLHPQWQIEFIERLVTCLPKISGGKVQIIITTHSPILVTDLPVQCISVLGNENSNTQRLTSCGGGLHPRNQTFGANIYDIYSYLFGMNRQRTGSISSKYIKKITGILDKEFITDDELNELKVSEKIIGNELILHYINKRINLR